MPSRRAFARDFLGSLCVVALVRAVGKADAFEGAVKPIAKRWLGELQAASADLRAGKVEQREWQERIERCLGGVDRADLMRAINYQRLAERVDFTESHESTVPVRFEKRPDLPQELSFSPMFFAMKKGVSVAPHGHQNMVSMHMILAGEAHGRHFDRIHDEPQYLTIRPTSDKALGPREGSTISDQRDNIHWFTALSDTVFMFNVHILGVDPSAPVHGRDYIDPSHGEVLSGGFIRARRLGEDEAYKLYGHV